MNYNIPEPTNPQPCVDKSYIPYWVIYYPAKEFLVDGVIVKGARGYHSSILQQFLDLRKIRRPHHKQPLRDSKKIKRLKK